MYTLFCLFFSYKATTRKTVEHKLCGFFLVRLFEVYLAYKCIAIPSKPCNIVNYSLMMSCMHNPLALLPNTTIANRHFCASFSLSCSLMGNLLFKHSFFCVNVVESNVSLEFCFACFKLLRRLAWCICVVSERHENYTACHRESNGRAKE